MLDQKALEGSITEKTKSPKMLELNNYFCHGNIALLRQFTRLYWLYQRVKNRIYLKRYEILSEQIV